MIAFFIDSGDPEIGAQFRQYVWGGTGFGDFLDRELAGHQYGQSVELFLIAFYLEGCSTTWLPKRIRPGPYNRKEKSIAVDVPIHRHEFLTKSERKRCEFILERVVMSLDAVRNVCERHKLDLDLDRLILNVQDCGEGWLNERRNLGSPHL